jgi:putative transposase
MIVCWQASTSLCSDLAIDALEMAIFNRRRTGADLSLLIHHSDRGVQSVINWSQQYLSIRYSQRLADNAIIKPVIPPSTPSRT